MMKRQKVLVLLLSDSALDSRVIAWAQYDGTGPRSSTWPAIAEEPPYATGLAALRDGWRLFQMCAAAAARAGRRIHDGVSKIRVSVRAMRWVRRVRRAAEFAADGDVRRTRLPAFRRRRAGGDQRTVLDEVGRPPQPGDGCAKRTRACWPAPAYRPSPRARRSPSAYPADSAIAQLLASAARARRDRKPRRSRTAFRSSLSARDVSAGVLRRRAAFRTCRSTRTRIRRSTRAARSTCR